MGDFFNRKSLLPAGQRTRLTSDRANPRVSSEPPSLEFEPRRARLSEPEVFERPTVIPDLPADEHARSLMRSAEALDESRSESAKGAGSEPERKAEVSLSFGALDLDLESEASALELVDQPGRERVSLEPATRPSPAANALPAQDENVVLSLSDLYQLGDFSGALEAAELRLASNPKDAEAERYRTRCQEVLTRMWTARLGSPDRPVKMLIAEDQLRWLSVDHRAGFVLSLIDGQATLEQILDIAGMPRLDALRILAELSERGVIEVVR